MNVKQSLLDSVVEDLCLLLEKSGIERTLAVGNLVLRRFFDDNDAVWRARHRNKMYSVRRLAAHPDCPLSKSALARAVAVAVFVREEPSVPTLGHLAPSHLELVVSLPNAERMRWLNLASSNQWSTRQLRDALVVSRQDRGDRRGRPRLSSVERALGGLASAVAGCESAAHTLEGSSLTAAQRAKVVGLRCRISQVVARLDGAAASPTTVPQKEAPTSHVA